MHSSYGINVGDVVEAVVASSCTMSEEELRTQASSLASAIMRNHNSHSRVMQEQLSIAEASLQQVCEERITTSMANFSEEREQYEIPKISALEASYTEKKKAALKQIKEKTLEEAEAKRQIQHEEALLAMGDRASDV